MSRKAARILERMRRTKSGWHPHHFHTLYMGFGFIMKAGRNHDIFIHPEFPEIRDTIPRHGELGRAYAKSAVENIDSLLRLREEREGRDQDE